MNNQQIIRYRENFINKIKRRIYKTPLRQNKELYKTLKQQYGEKRKIITFLVYVFVAIGIMFVMIWIGNNLTVLSDELVECVKLWYANLNYEVQEIINKIFVLLFLIGIMLRAIFIAPNNYASKGNIVEKLNMLLY